MDRNVTKETKNTSETLDKNLQALNQTLQRTNSFKYSFLRGLVIGTGTAIGATVIAAIVIAILARSLQRFEGVPGLDRVLNASGIDKALDSESTHSN